MSQVMIPIPFLGFSDPISSGTHLLAAGAALIGTGVLITKGRGNTARVVSLMIYSFALIFLFSMSGVFHLLDRDTVARDVFQRLDHSGIWILIAATFTPIHVILFRRHWRWAILLWVWTVAITGLVLEVIFFKDFSEAVLVSLFLGLGWVGGVTAFIFRKSYRDRSLRFLVLGAIFYSAGAIIDFLKWPVLIPGVLGPHEIFHAFVVAAAAAHWVFIYMWCDHPVNNTISFEVRIFADHVRAQALDESIEVEAPSLEEVKELIRETVDQRFHATIHPTIHLRYFHEETLKNPRLVVGMTNEN